MKKKLLWLLIILCLMILIPFITTDKKEIQRKADINLMYKETDIIDLLCKEFKAEYNTETLKALSIILQNNYTKHEVKPLSKEQFYKIYGKNADTYYKNIKNAVNDTFGNVITYKNEVIYIPYCYVQNSTNITNQHAYIKNSATPWDCLKKEYSNEKAEGLSLYSINHLCENGLSYQDGLFYFLKDVKIEKKTP